MTFYFKDKERKLIFLFDWYVCPYKIEWGVFCLHRKDNACRESRVIETFKGKNIYRCVLSYIIYENIEKK